MNSKDQKLLLELARNSIESAFNDTDPTIHAVGHLTQLKGCFVTLHKHGQLRGCIGFPKPIMPLYEQIIASSKAAAFEDPRFSALHKNELREIVIEISILFKPELIKVNNPEEYLERIELGIDGLVIKGSGSAFLLPQVAIENNLNIGQFLEILCEKSGMGRNAWMDLNNKIYKFKAEIFREDGI